MIGRPRYVVLGRSFFEHAREILDFADHALAAGDPVDLDELATLIASHIRPSLLFYYPLAAPGELSHDPSRERQCAAGAHNPALEGATPSPAPNSDGDAPEAVPV